MNNKLKNGIVTGVLVAISFTVAAVFGASTRAEASVRVAVAPLQTDVAAGAIVYSDTCSRCHEPDGSGLPGEIPPLLGNSNALDATYVELVVRDGLSGPIEVLGVAYDDSMRAFGSRLSDDEVTAVVAYVITLAERDPSGTPTAPIEAEPGNIAEGYNLFLGSTAFSNGGAACAACHVAGKVGNLGGWSLGPDLTDTVEVFGGEDGLTGWLSNPSAPTMEPIFDDHPMTDAEIADIVAFMADAPSQSKPDGSVDGLVVAGFAGLFVLIGGMAIAWRGMRQTYVERLRSRL